jgi:membrane protease YdiL (CAAX protease family)
VTTPDLDATPGPAPKLEPAVVGRRRLLALAFAGEGCLALVGLVWARLAGYPLALGPLGPAILAGVASALGIAVVQYWLLRLAPDAGPVRALRRLYREILAPLFAGITLVDILIISALAGIGEELLFRGAWQAAFGPVIASLAFGLCHIGSRGTIVLGAWAAIVGGYFAWLTYATAGLLAPILAHALYDAIALSYIRWGRAPESAPAPVGTGEHPVRPGEENG